jgi:uncharacterized membrane protein YkvA (DUF1232 family)
LISVPDFVPVVGQLDAGIIAALVLRRILRGTDRALLAAHWLGPAELLLSPDDCGPSAARSAQEKP